MRISSWNVSLKFTAFIGNLSKQRKQMVQTLRKNKNYTHFKLCAVTEHKVPACASALPGALPSEEHLCERACDKWLSIRHRTSRGLGFLIS